MESEKIYSPVLIITYSRFNHFKNCVESLSQCIGAQKTDLYVAIDYPNSENVVESYNKIYQFALDITGFKSVNIIKRENNFGPNKNYFTAVNEVFEKFETLIFTEDDNTFSTTFLNYMNLGLTEYKKRKDIFAICGYNDDITIPSFYKEGLYLRTGCCMWGVSFWKEKYNMVNWNMDEFSEWLNKPKYKKRIIRFHLKALPQLLRMQQQNKLQVDAFLFLYLLKNNFRSIYPTLSRVRNLGHDGSGVNCGNNEKYTNQKIYSKKQEVFFPNGIRYNENLQRSITNQLNGKLTRRIRLKLLTYPKWIQGISNFFMNNSQLVFNRIKRTYR